MFKKPSKNLICLILFLIIFKCNGQVSFEFDASHTDKIITNKGTEINFWDLSEWQNPLPVNFYNTYFPFVKRVQLMAAIGGNDQRDLFINPQDTSVLTDYNFEKLKIACENILNQNLKPMISLCWIPQKFSNNPYIGAFNTNVRPPKDYNLWYQYITACVNYLISNFGINEVRSWWWCVGVEFENKDWFYDGYSSLTTKQSFFKLYDYTVAALEATLGKPYVNVGAHSMTCSSGYWDEREFIDHCSVGTNYYTDTTGTQLDFYQISYYDKYADGFNDANFLNNVNFIKQHLAYRGYENIPFGIAEGRVLKGWDNKPLAPREVLHPIQGSMDAKKIIKMIENDIDWFSHWSCYSGIYNNTPVNLVGANIYLLHYKMNGSALMQKIKTGVPLDPSNEIDGIASYDENQHKIYLFFYNNNPNRNSLSSETINVFIKNIMPYQGDNVIVKQWIADDNHGNFWSEWYDIQLSNNLTDNDFLWSRYAIGPMSNNGWNVWGNNLNYLQPLSQIDLSSTTIEYLNNNQFSLNFDIEHHGVVLYEISNVKAINTTTIENKNSDVETVNIQNPVQNIIQIKCEHGYKIYNEEGKLVMQNLNNTNEIKVSILKAGMYFLETGNKIFKFIKQ